MLVVVLMPAILNIEAYCTILAILAQLDSVVTSRFPFTQANHVNDRARPCYYLYVSIL